MKQKLNIALDADGIIFDLFIYQLEKGIIEFDKIDDTIIINNKTIRDLVTMTYEEKSDFLVMYIEQYISKTGDNINMSKYDIHDIFNLEPTFIEKKLSHSYATKNGVSEVIALKELNDKLKIRRQIFWLKNIIDYCINSYLISGVVDKIKGWQEEGHGVGNITARVFVTQNTIVGLMFRLILEEVYKKIDIKFDYIDYCSEKNSPEEKMLACYKRSVDVMIEDKLDVSNEISKMELTKVCLLDKHYNKGHQLKNTIRCTDFNEIDEQVKIAYKELNNYSFIQNALIPLTDEQINSMSKIELWHYLRKQKEAYKNKDLNTDSYKKNYDVTKTKLHYKLYRCAYPIVMLPYKSIVRPLVIGKENIPYQKGVIFAVNHLTMMDELLVASAIGNRNVNFLASSQFLSYPIIGTLYKNLDCIFVDRKDAESRHNSSDIIKYCSANQRDIIIHVEGTRKRPKDHELDLLPVKKGAIESAKITGAPIVPITITATYGFKKGLPIVRIDKPINILPDMSIDDGIQKLTNIMLESVRKNKIVEEEILSSGSGKRILYYEHETGKKLVYYNHNKRNK